MDPFIWPNFTQMAEARGVGPYRITPFMPGQETETTHVVRRSTLREFVGNGAWRSGISEILDWEEVDVEPLPSVYQVVDGRQMFLGFLTDPGAYLLREVRTMEDRGIIRFNGGRPQWNDLDPAYKFLVQVSMATHVLDPRPAAERTPGYEVQLDGMLIDAARLIEDRAVQGALGMGYTQSAWALQSTLYETLRRSRAMSNELGWLLERCPEAVFDLLVHNAVTQVQDVGSQLSHPGPIAAEYLARQFRGYLVQPETNFHEVYSFDRHMPQRVAVGRSAPWQGWFNPFSTPEPASRPDGPASGAPVTYAEPPSPPPRKVFVPVRSVMGVQIQVVTQGDSLSVEPVAQVAARPRQLSKRIPRK